MRHRDRSPSPRRRRERSSSPQGSTRDKDMSSLKVNGLTYRTIEREVEELFERYGKIGEVFIPKDRFSRKSRGFAFVRFYEKRDADRALKAVDGKIFDGRKLTIERARNDGGGGGGGGGARMRSRSRDRRRSRSRSRRRRSRSGRRASSGQRRRSRSRSRESQRRRSPSQQSRRRRSPSQERRRSVSQERRKSRSPRRQSPSEEDRHGKAKHSRSQEGRYATEDRTSSPAPFIISSPGPFIASSPGPFKAPPNSNIVTRSKSVENNDNSSSGNFNGILCSVLNDVSGQEVVAKQLEDMFPHFSPEYLLEKAKKYVTIENAVDELLNEAALKDSSKVKDDEMKLLLLGEEDMFKKVTLSEKRDFNPEDPLENKFRLAKGHYLSVSGQFASPIESIDYVENRALMEIFERKKSELRAEGKDTNEYLLFHGTNDVNVDSILKENFRMDFAGKHGQAYGRGIYFSEKTMIPNQYMNGAKKTLLLCRVLLGREFLGLDKDIPKGFDSKSVQPDQEKRANINIIKEVDQILPCFVLNLAPSSGPGPNVLPGFASAFPSHHPTSRMDV